MTHRSSDVLLSDDLKCRLDQARKAANNAVARGDTLPENRWGDYGLAALMQGRDFATIALYKAAQAFFESRRK